MKKIINTLLILIISISVLGQAPQYFKYQAVLRDNSGEPMASEEVDVKIDILRGSATGTQVFTETHETETNEFGLVNIKVGSESSLAGIDWSAYNYFIRVSVDGTVMGTTQLLSVPYALHAGTADESDPLFAASTAAGIDEDDIDNWDEAYSWGDHEGLYRPDDWTPDWSDMPDGTVVGEMLFWDGTGWVAVEPGEYHYKLHFCDGVPQWGPCPPKVPVVTTLAVTEIEENEAKGGGNVINQGSQPVTEYGLVWGESVKPTVDVNDGIETVVANIEGAFYFDLTGLTGETTYYVRAYAINDEGIAYGNQVEFTTDAATVFLATLTTDEVTNIDKISATSGGNVTANGGAAVTARGIVWGKSSLPTLEVNDGQLLDGDGGLGAFVSGLTGLDPNTNYYVRAYAVNSVGTAYGNQRFFATLQDAERPTVTTATITDITQTTATGGGNVTSAGDGDVLLRGVCWSTEPNPTLSDSYTTDGDGVGVFSSSITGLEPGITYYVRAYASNSHGIAFGEQVEFTTLAGKPILHIVSTNSGNPGFRLIDVNVTNSGGEEVTARGIVWDTEENPVPGADNFTTEGDGIGEFSSILTEDELTVNTTYYIRAYAENSEGIGYSEQRAIHFWDYHDIVTYHGYQYNTVMIGDQEWMTENLKTALYRNSLPVVTGLSNTDWQNDTEGAYAIYANIESYGEAYGYLYNWYAVINEHELCPVGWRAATEADFIELKDFVESIFDDGRSANKLKSCRQVNSPLGGECAATTMPYWNQDATHYGTDEFGFSALAGGSRGSTGGFGWIGERGSFWSTTPAATQARAMQLNFNAGHIMLMNLSREFGYSVRCIRDTGE